jgi:hypothetical protein
LRFPLFFKQTAMQVGNVISFPSQEKSWKQDKKTQNPKTFHFTLFDFFNQKLRESLSVPFVPIPFCPDLP